jgi:CHAT domain
MRKRTKILIVAANPKDTSQLRLDEEVREIEAALQRSQRRNQFSVRSTWAPRTKDLRRALLDQQLHIVHFSGHGDPEGLVLEDAVGQAVIVPPEALEGLFNLFRDNLQCVLLNACYSEAQATAIAKRISYVIGMKEEIADDIALEFAVGFYDALGAGRSIEQAFEFGYNAIKLLGRSDAPLPVILSNSGNQAGIGTNRGPNRVYRFRAECQADVDELRRILGTKIDKITIVNSPPFPDVEIEVEVDLSLEELRDTMRRVADGHVMVQTVARNSEYTGERDYDI